MIEALTGDERQGYKIVVSILSGLLALMLGAVVYMAITVPVVVPECLTVDSSDCLWEKRNHGSEVGDRDFIRYRGETYYLERASEPEPSDS